MTTYTVIAAADQAAYAAKDAGKDCVRASGDPPRLALVGRA
jgi:PleD family two-component response regulator